MIADRRGESRIARTTSRRGFLKATGAAALVGVTSALAGCTGEAESEPAGGGSGDGGAEQKPEPTQRHYAYRESGVGLSNLGWAQSEYGNLLATGTATNLTDSMLDYVQITVAFVDRTGAQLETGLDNTTDLAAGQRWRYAVMYPGMDTERVDNAYTTGIDAY
ncbi:MAG TPA: FxLYD domain-containing protein [Halococcus sp.]|nr:FxLYD domain-containing protein [Halococcus sp.]